MRMVTPLLFLAVPAWAAPSSPGVDVHGTWHVEIPLDVAPGDLEPQEIEELLEDLAGQAPADAAAVDLWVRDEAGDLIRLESLLPEPPPVPIKEDLARSRPVAHPGRADGDLSGKGIYLSQCHGFIWYDSLRRFSTQRGNNHDTVEDLHNPEGMNQFLTAYLENAGASVFTAKERDHNPQRVVVDDSDAAFEETGDGFRDGPAGYGHKATWR